MSPRAVEKRARPGNVGGPAQGEPATELTEVGAPAERAEEPVEESAQE